jgi:membrane protein YqaA with SNARE-associated domain
MILILSTFGVGVASALIPLINIELYVAGVGTAGDGEALTIAIAAGAGQTVGKVFWYEAARRSLDTAWVQKRLSAPKIRSGYERWVTTMRGRPWYAGIILLAASLGGIPPLLVMAAVAGALRVPYWVFVPTIFVGRAIRLWLVIEGVGFFFD